MSLPAYSQIARDLTIPMCRGVRPNGQTCYVEGHEPGVVADNLVHWRDRRPSRAGIKTFLLLEAKRRYPLGEEPVWVRIWTQIKAARAMAAEIHLALGPWTLEKAAMKAMLAKVLVEAPERQKALLWASRS